MNVKPDTISITIPSELKELKHIEKLSVKVAKKTHLDEDQRDNLSIAVTEVVGNAIVHGNKKNPEKTVTVTFDYNVRRITVTVQDQGDGFDPDALADPLDPKNLLKESGRGIFIMRSLMDDVSFSFSPEGTKVQFTMKLRDSQP